VDGARWVSSEVVRSPNQGDERFYVFERSSQNEKGYMVDAKHLIVSLPSMSFWSLWGIVLPKEPSFAGVRMATYEDKAPYDPDLKISAGGKSFSFRDEDRHLISVTGL